MQYTSITFIFIVFSIFSLGTQCKSSQAVVVKYCLTTGIPPVLQYFNLSLTGPCEMLDGNFSEM